MQLIWLSLACAWITADERADLLDGDGDGFLNPQLGGADCDDDDATVHDGRSFRDADGDGFGDPDASSCEEPAAGYVTDATDCDDADAGTHPGALQVCDDVDNDCDDVPGDCNLEDAGRLLRGDVEGAHAGTAAAAIDADGDAYGDVAVGAPDGPEGGFVAIVSGGPWEDDGGDGDWLPLGGARTTWTGTPGDRGGETLLAADFDADGDVDLAIGAPGASLDGRGDGVGIVHLLFAPLGAGDVEPDAAIVGESEDVWAGAALAVGDANWDGVVDVVVGAPEADRGLGLVYLVYGPVPPEGLDLWETTQGRGAKFVPPPDDGDDGYGSALLLVDIEGDGRDDVVVGAPRGDEGREDAGHGRICTGEPRDVVYLEEDCIPRFRGAGTGDLAGTALAAADLDGNGYPELFVGAPGADGDTADVGVVYVVWGEKDTWWGTVVLGEAGQTTLRADVETGSRVGAAVSVPGDLDGDGGLDVVVGAPGLDHAAEGPNVGGVWVVPGTFAPGVVDLVDPLVCLYSGPDGGGCAAGGALAPGGDVDGDGADDVLVGGVGFTDGTTEGGGTLVLMAP